MKKNSVLVGLLLTFALVFSGCAPSTSSDSNQEQAQPGTEVPSNAISDTQKEDPVNPGDEAQEIIAASQILLFNGIGISLSDWKETEKIIRSQGLTYKLVNSSALTAMPLADLKKYKLILVPGGDSNVINNNLSTTTKIKVRQAVRDGGVSFLGICAGAFAAVGIDTKSNTTAYYGFGVAQGDYLKFWYPNGNSSLIAAVPRISFADGTRRNMIWYNGPSTPEWAGGVIARYPDGKAAISQTWTGLGFVIVSGPHPEAPASWQYDSGPDPDGLDHDIAVKLIKAALYRKPLRTY